MQSNASNAGPRPVFIIGAPRSGTSITTWVLGQHPNIQPMPETAWIVSMAAGGLLSHAKGSERGRLSHLSNVEFPLEPFMARLGESVHKIVCDVYEERCRQRYGDWREKGIRRNLKHPNAAMQIRRHPEDPKERWVDGTPMNTAYVWGLRLLFPEAQFLHLLRRPEDVAASLMKFKAAGGRSHSPGAGLANWLDHTHSALLAQKAFGPKAVRTFRYEALVETPRETLGEILEFLGEPFSEDCLEPLGMRINSSQVGEERAGLVEKVRRLKAFEEATAVYEKCLASEFPETDAAEAEAELKAFFLTHAAKRFTA